jgi:dihydropteroate synthase
MASLDLISRIQAIDEDLSRRELILDPCGYFVIYIDREQELICAKYYQTVINDQGLATDPVTGKVIPARGKVEQSAVQVFSGRTAKELCVTLFEKNGSDPLVSQLSHAAYLGREFQRAELALSQGRDYIQD